MREIIRVGVFAALSGCGVIAGSGGGNAPFQGVDNYKARVKAVGALEQTALSGCKAAQWTGKGGFFEVTADAGGKIAARQIAWDGDPALAKCFLDAAVKQSLPPLAGPPVSELWGVAPPNATMPTAGKAPETEMVGINGRLQEQGVVACAQRYLPPEMPVDIEVTFLVFGTRAYVVNVANSNSKDGDYDTCVQQYVGGQEFPPAPADSYYPVRLRFHVGRSGKSES